MRSFLLFFCGTISLVVAGYLGYSVFFNGFGDGETNTKANKSFQFVLTLNSRSDPGDILSKTNIIWLKTEQRNVLEENITLEEFEHLGHSFFALTKGNQARLALVKSQIVWPDDVSYLAKILRAGYRAISVPFEAEEGILSTLHPGSRLDVVYAITPNGAATNNSLLSTAVIASNVRVLQIGSANKTAKTGNANHQRLSSRNVVLEVRLSQLNAISSARLSGILIPALRAKSEKSIVSDTAIILSDLQSGRNASDKGNAILEREKQDGETQSEFRKIFIQRRDVLATEIRENPLYVRATSKPVGGQLK